MKISFVARHNKRVNGRVPLYARIKGLGKPTEISLKKYVRPALWDSRNGRVAGRGIEVDDLNEFIEAVRYDLGQAYRELYREGKDLTAAAVKNGYLALDLDEVMGLLAMFDYHFTRESGRLADSTLKNYKTTREYVKKYLKSSFRVNELPLDRLNFAFIDGFEVFLRRFPTPEGQRPLRNNGIMKHIERLQKVVNLAVKLDHISKNPFKMYQRHMDKPKQVYLTAEELKVIAAVEPENEGHQLVRDLFVFGCYSGLAYVDLQALQPEDIVIGLDRMLWISNVRRKSGQPFKVPLLPLAREIFLKYQKDPRSLEREACFPKFSAQKINSYLKDIATEAEIRKNLTYYAARHTFATTVTLSNGVPIESVSKMLGHSKLTTTQIYAKVVDAKLSSDMMVLKNKLSASAEESKKSI
tara:strand:+ start:17694 stop:18929 length:1236 start_codon:yes stop_codon:yes gene_type:complete